MGKKYNFEKKSELIITTLERARLDMDDFIIHARNYDLNMSFMESLSHIDKIKNCSENLKEAIDDFIDFSIKYTI